MNLLIKWLIYVILISCTFSQELNINTLTDIVLQHNSILKLSKKNVEVKTAQLKQSRKFSNPNLSIESDFGIEPEISGMLTQDILLGGKRKQNIQLREFELNLAKLEYDEQKSQVLNESYHLFIEILFYQEMKSLQRNRILISEELLEAVKKKVIAGKFSPVEASRAKIQLYQEKIKLLKIENQLPNAWNSLSTFYEDNSLSYNIAVGHLSDLYHFSTPFKINNEFNINIAPKIVQANIQIQIQNIKVKLEKLKIIPDIEFGTGIKKNELGNSFQLGVTLPIPLFNQNNGNINRELSVLEMTQLELIKIKNDINSQIENIINSLNEIKSEIILLETMIIPEANSAYSIIMDGYMNGRYTYLEVVDAKEMWFLSQIQYLNALQDYHNKTWEINRILGRTNHSFLGEN
ncbi:MAG: TolC family protein [Candidatus Marinimicrobia bacterium]|nr:TolC family protein [Candidatus Neomarinimicrobiota bacterium]